MPSTSAKQQRFFGAQLGKKRRGEKTDVDMTEKQITDFAKKRVKRKKALPKRGSGLLSPLGQRTLGGYQEKFGDSDGHAKFERAVEGGMLERKKMFKGAPTRDAQGGFRAQNG